MKKIINRSVIVNKASLRETLLQSRQLQTERAENLSRKMKESGMIDKLRDMRRLSLNS
ncbi:hypothetical protein [Chitinophaga cymbidii]|uniref:hypothetical protein n=1 Tax=Chitinophaga cymbidii TaxID=1096750 RepID=UPI00164A5F02|nr:hypothetical protein [Chitinophaga cymbidii]